MISHRISVNIEIYFIGIIKTLCENWNLTEEENYGLQFTEQNNRNYVTEKNRFDVKNGQVLRLSFSPTKAANDILAKLKNGTNVEKSTVLEKLSNLSSDLTFGLEFISAKGMDIIIDLIQNETSIGDMLKYAMLSFVELMEHGTISWDIPQPKFIKRNIHFIRNSTSVQIEVIQSSLTTLENIVTSSKNYPIVENDVTLEILWELLKDQINQIVQQNTIALINALFMKADDERRRSIANTLSMKKFRSAFLACVSGANIGISHQLYVLQTLLLGLLENRMKTKSIENQETDEKLKELRRIAFEEVSNDGNLHNNDASRRNAANNSNHNKKLGFKYDINPAQDFMEIPPGMLALDCMLYFARNYRQSYRKVVHENSSRTDEHECPFGRTSIELVKVLCEILHIGEIPNEQGQDYQAMFFTHDHPFEEFFCICIVVLNKTWKDMRATNEDFTKVFIVIREQVMRSLKMRPNSLEEFKTRINALTYAQIVVLREQERVSKVKYESTAPAIVALKEKITPEILALIKAQRLDYLVEGTRFSKYSRGQRSKDKYWYARLSPNHKVIHYGDCDEKTNPTLEELGNKILVIDIKQLLIGKECPNTKYAKKTTVNLGFSISFENADQATLDFVAPDEIVFNYWTDGINALLDQSMISKQKDEDFETLLGMEIKLRLLDTEGLDIPNDPPPIPDDPENYDFCFEC